MGINLTAPSPIFSMDFWKKCSLAKAKEQNGYEMENFHMCNLITDLSVKNKYK